MPKRAEAAPVVSAAHLAEGRSPALSEVEYGLNLVVSAYHRWMPRAMAAAGVPGLSVVEVLILHSVRHRDRPKRIADLMLVLDIEDTHIVTYALRKLEAAGLIATTRAGKEKLVRVTPKGDAACARYAALREQLLVEGLAAAGPAEARMSELASLLRALSGFYNQAARAAATL